MSGYILGGHVRVPGQTSEFPCGNKTFRVQFGADVTSDKTAIKKSEECIAEKRQETLPGEEVEANLCCGSRVIFCFH